MNHGSGLWPASPPGHFERVDDDLRGNPVRDRPPDDAARVGIDHRGAVDPPVVRAVLRDVAEPEPVRLGRAELSLHEVLVSRGVGLPSTAFAPMRHPGQAIEAHQPCDALLADVNAEPEPQLGEHPRGSIGAAGVAVNLPDRRRERLISDRPRRRRARRPLVVAGLRDLQEPAGHRDGDTVSGELLDQPEPYFGSTFSLAK